MALGVLFGAGVRLHALGARWGPTGSGVGMRLHRTSASGKLVKLHFSFRVADFVWTRVF